MATYDHWLPLHIGDYVADTMHLSTLQHGIYIRLIMHYWKHRALPTDVATLAQIAGLTPAKFKRNSVPVCALFADDMTHKRLDTELQHAQKVSESRRVNGQDGAKARWQTPSTRARATPQPQPQPQPQPEKKEKNPPRATRDPPGDGARVNGHHHHHHRPDRNAAFDAIREINGHAAPPRDADAPAARGQGARVVDLTRRFGHGKRHAQ